MADDALTGAPDPEAQADAFVTDVQGKMSALGVGLLGTLEHWLTLGIAGPSAEDRAQYAEIQNQFDQWTTTLRGYARTGIDGAGNPYTWAMWFDYGNSIADGVGLAHKVFQENSVAGTLSAAAQAAAHNGPGAFLDELKTVGWVLAGAVVLYLGVQLAVRR